MHTKSLTIGLLFVLLTGCALRPPKLYHPDYPGILNIGYTLEQYRADEKAYNDAVKAGDLATAKLARDRAAGELLIAIDNGFEKYAQGLGALRSTASLGSDILQSGLAAGSNIFTNGATKNILSGSLLGVKSITGSVRAEIHLDVGPETMILAMKASRTPYREKIEAGLKLDTSQYSLNQARADLSALFWAGTLESGKVQISEQAGKAVQK